MPVVVPMRRPKAMSSSGTLCTPQTDSATNPTATPTDNSRAWVRATRIKGISTRRPPNADKTNKTRSVFCVPMDGIRIRLAINAPQIAPAVLAA